MDSADEVAELAVVAEDELCTSWERVTKSCCAAVRLPLPKSCPNCFNSVKNWAIALDANRLVLEIPAVDID